MVVVVVAVAVVAVCLRRVNKCPWEEEQSNQ